MKLLKNSLIIFGACVMSVVIAISAFRWGLFGEWPIRYHASDKALAAMSSNELVEFKQEEWLVFTPKAAIPKTGFIFYPCALCDPKGFAGIMREIASQGFLVLIVPTPSYMAIFDTDRALEVKTRYPDIRHWVLGGHSIGGGASAMFLASNPEAVDALLMWDSYSNADYDISAQKLPVMSIYGNKHHAADRMEKFAQAKPFLPAHTQYQAIDGGDHFQFGSWQQEDIAARNTATITELDQQQQIIQHSVEFLRAIESNQTKTAAN